jgi:hypothetical protein
MGRVADQFGQIVALRKKERLVAIPLVTTTRRMQPWQPFQ